MAIQLLNQIIEIGLLFISELIRVAVTIVKTVVKL